jgi:hypothetical protein
MSLWNKHNIRSFLVPKNMYGNWISKYMELLRRQFFCRMRNNKDGYVESIFSFQFGGDNKRIIGARHLKFDMSVNKSKYVYIVWNTDL